MVGLVQQEWSERLSAIRLDIRKIVEGIRTGLHRSFRRGASAVFVDHRDYTPGDDPRLIDWRASARKEGLVIKRLEQESELELHLWLDASASMAFGEGAQEKARFAATLLAVFATLAQSQGDAVALTRFDEGVLEELPPRSSLSHLRLIEENLAKPPARGARTRLSVLGSKVNTSKRTTKRRGLIILASDLLDLDPHALDGLKAWTKGGFEFWVFQILHREEIELPGNGPFRFEGLEGEPPVEADPAEIRSAYQRELQAHLERQRNQLVEMGAFLRLVCTDENIVDIVLQHLFFVKGALARFGGHRRWA
ncbi:MAG: DUF58 domain-containing protein [Sandaracinaceae bacterium]|nr:DUF58 domain-containing protein [Sandaracinaceae bacterium]MDW8245837.1 DUF58 domain-containing protein [Sandaracinaceae bacterium]